MDFKFFIRDTSDAPLENEYFEWGCEQFGNIGKRWDADFRGFYFAEERDVTMFLLRWGSHPNLRELHVDD